MTTLTKSRTPAVTPATSTEQPFRLAGLDGLRALAVTLVIVFHLAPGLIPGGYLGVDVFFVISGFLITTLLLREHAATGAIALWRFWQRRARRLLPAVLLVVLVSVSAASIIGGDILVGIGRQVLGATTFSYNWLAIVDGSSYFDETTPELLRNLWSLAVEEQFYLVWPVLVLALVWIRRRGWTIAIVGALAVVSAVAMGALSLLGADATRVYYGTDTHSFGLALGAALAVASRSWSPRVLEWRRATLLALPAVGALAIVGILALGWFMPENSSFVYTGGLALVAVLSACAVAGSIVPGSPLGRVLELGPLRWVGERSYGLYLWHWPIAVLVGAAVPAWHQSSGGEWAIGGVALLLTVIAAELSYRFIEQPIRRTGLRASVTACAQAWRTSRTSRALAATASVAGIAVFALTGVAIVTAPQQGSAQARIERGEAAIEAQAADDAAASAPDAAAPALPGGDQIVAVGDSVMLAAAPELQKNFPGIAIDAVVSRGMSEAPHLVQALVAAHVMRPILVVGLGTNRSIDVETLRSISAIAGPSTQIILVNAQAPRGWVPTVNTIIADYARQQRNVELANWHDAIQPRLDVLSRDQIHPGGPIGGQIYAVAISDALQRLAELPPLLNSNDYGLAARPG